MKRWYPEDWIFRIEVLRVGQENRAEECRLGLEPGDVFECAYDTPAGFWPDLFHRAFPEHGSGEVWRRSAQLGRQWPC